MREKWKSNNHDDHASKAFSVWLNILSNIVFVLGSMKTFYAQEWMVVVWQKARLLFVLSVILHLRGTYNYMKFYSAKYNNDELNLYAFSVISDFECQ